MLKFSDLHSEDLYGQVVTVKSIESTILVLIHDLMTRDDHLVCWLQTHFMILARHKVAFCGYYSKGIFDSLTDTFALTLEKFLTHRECDHSRAAIPHLTCGWYQLVCIEGPCCHTVPGYGLNSLTLWFVFRVPSDQEC